MAEFQNLIIVPGHAAFKAEFDPSAGDPVDESNWVLQSFQNGEVQYYIEHVKAGVEHLAQNVGALLLFSGGRTREQSGDWSEAATYSTVAAHYNYWRGAGNPSADDIKSNISLEEYARDSLENVQFSIERYRELTGQRPQHITVVGWEFKKPRFDFHRQTLEIDTADFTYLSVNNPSDLQGALKGEQRTLEQFRQDPYGQHPPLSDKKQERNPFNIEPPYILEEPRNQ